MCPAPCRIWQRAFTPQMIPHFPGVLESGGKSSQLDDLGICEACTYRLSAAVFTLVNALQIPRWRHIKTQPSIIKYPARIESAPVIQLCSTKLSWSCHLLTTTNRPFSLTSAPVKTRTCIQLWLCPSRSNLLGNHRSGILDA